MMRSALFAVPVLALAACEPALGPVALTANTPECFTELPITEKLVGEARPEEMQVSPAGGQVAPFLIGHLSYLRHLDDESPDNDDDMPQHGGVLFVKGDAGWRAILPNDGEASVGVYVSPDGPDVYVLNQLQVEGPGQSFTLTRSTDGLKTAACTVINFPDDLNQPSWSMEYLTPESFQIQQRGKGTLFASAILDQETDQSYTAWYRYDTTDGGATWSAPERIDAPTESPTGPLLVADAKAPAELVADLKAFAAGK